MGVFSEEVLGRWVVLGWVGLAREVFGFFFEYVDYCVVLCCLSIQLPNPQTCRLVACALSCQAPSLSH